MTVGKIIGTVVCTKKDENMVGLKMQVVQPLNMVTFQAEGIPVVAVDAVGAGDGEIVMLVSGSSARQTSITGNKPVDATIMAIIDTIDIHGKKTFDRNAT